MMRYLNLFIKRFADIIGSFIGMIIVSPILIIVAIAIKLDSKGPVFFRQERLGKNGEVFKIFKFRTMVVNAEHMGDGLKVSSAEDSRITKVGRFLRKTSIDELPQLLNVLIGEMSLVGPRPPATYYPYDGYENYPDWAKKRFEMRPGITGYAAAKDRKSITWDEKIKKDVEYVEKFSIWFDIRILLLTFVNVLKSKNVY